jgi:hypothetical protein
LMALWSDLTLRGVVTGSGPSDPVERANWRAAGHVPYAINLRALGIDHSPISFRAIEPLGMILAMSADVTERAAEVSDLLESDNPRDWEKIDNMIGASIRGISNATLSQTFVRGATDFFRFMTDRTYPVEQYMQNVASGLMPRFIPSMDDIAKSMDPNGPTPEIHEAYSIWEAFKNEFPGVGKYPVRNLFGHARHRSPALGPDWLSPLYMGDDALAKSPIAQEIVKQKIGARLPGRVQYFLDRQTGITVPVDLRNYPAVWDEYMQLQGHKLELSAFGGTAEDTLNRIVTGNHALSSLYERLPNGDEQGINDKGSFIKGILAKYREAARDELMRRAMETQGGTELDKELRALADTVSERAARRRKIQLEGSQ